MTQLSNGCRICPRQCGADRGGTPRLLRRGRTRHLCRPGCPAPLGRTLHLRGNRLRGGLFQRLSAALYLLPELLHRPGPGGEAHHGGTPGGDFLELQQQHAANINLVTPTHYTPQIITAVRSARAQGLAIPIVYNCGGYESVDTLRTLEGIVDIYLTDFKYMQSEPAERYSRAADYPQVAQAALAEMVRQQPEPRYDGAGMMTRGVLVRHLLLPGHVQNAKAVVKYVYETYGDRVWLSLMNQYTPLPQVRDYPEIDRKVTRHEYDRLIRYALSLGVENAFIQEGGTAAESFIPAFDYQGL
ncbi:MAG: radical SAM protein [Acutalibacteraceae bacterium]